LRTFALLAIATAGSGAMAATVSADPPPLAGLPRSPIAPERPAGFSLRPDLTIPRLQVYRTAGTLAITVRNAGATRASGSVTHVTVYVRHPITLERRTVGEIDVTTAALAPGERRDHVVELDVPGADFPDPPAGEADVTVDARGDVAESDETNNRAGTSGPPR